MASVLEESRSWLDLWDTYTCGRYSHLRVCNLPLPVGQEEILRSSKHAVLKAYRLRLSYFSNKVMTELVRRKGIYERAEKKKKKRKKGQKSSVTPMARRR